MSSWRGSLSFLLMLALLVAVAFRFAIPKPRTVVPPELAPFPPVPCCHELDRWKRRYLQFMRDTLLGLSFRTVELQMTKFDLRDGEDPKPFWKPLDLDKRHKGLDWPVMGMSMIGEMRFDTAIDLVERVIAAGVPGCFFGAGAWRAGLHMMAKAMFDAWGELREVVVADTFSGVPKPRDAKKHNDKTMWNSMAYLRVSKQTVTENFRSFGLLDQHVHFCEGKFVDTLPTCLPEETIAVLYIDGDMYESTSDVLWNLYTRVSMGGFIIMDDIDYSEVKRAIHDFHAQNNLAQPTLVEVGDGKGAYWQKVQELENVNMLFYEEQIKN